MNKFIFAAALTLGLTGAAIAEDIDPKTDGCIVESTVAQAVIQNVPDATGLKVGNTIVFTAPSRPDQNFVVTFDTNGCAIHTETAVQHKQ